MFPINDVVRVYVDGFNLYSTTVDVAEIAVRYGGGGHTGASGFVCAYPPFLEKLEEKNNE